MDLILAYRMATFKLSMVFHIHTGFSEKDIGHYTLLLDKVAVLLCFYDNSLLKLSIT